MFRYFVYSISTKTIFQLLCSIHGYYLFLRKRITIKAIITTIAITIKIPKSIPALNIPDTTPHEFTRRDNIIVKRVINLLLLQSLQSL
jgi:hypothetical protein